METASEKLMEPSISLAEDHICCSKRKDSEMEAGVLHVCGACTKCFSTICALHSHIKMHNKGGSYYYFESSKTAFPVFDKCSVTTQTERGGKFDEMSWTDVHDSAKRVKVEENGRNFFSPDSESDSKWLNDNESGSLMYTQSEDTDPAVDGVLVKREIKTADDMFGGLNENSNDTNMYWPEESENERKRKQIPDEHEVSRKRKRKHGNQQIKKTKVKVRGSRNKLLGNKGKKKYKSQAEAKDKTLEKAVEKLTDDNLAATDKESVEDKGESSSGDVEKNGTKIRRVRRRSEKPADRKICCKVCNAIFQKKAVLHQHIKAEHSDIEHLCYLCGERCESSEAVDEHRKTVHRLGYFQCELCDKVLSCKQMLEGHMLVHKGIKPFSCNICEPTRYFTRKGQLTAHMEIHSEEQNLQCEFCGKPFNARYRMLSHVKYCGGFRTHKCEFCEKSFVTNHGLQRHRRRHTGEKPYVCEFCAFASGNPACLARHLRTHTGEKPFECQYCGQSFAARSALNKHVRIHTQEKPYQCRFCAKAFTQNWNLKTHERQHTGETPYRCHVCGVGYKQNVLLKTHLKTHFGVSANINSKPDSSGSSDTPNQSKFDDQSNASQTGSQPENLKVQYSELQSVNQAVSQREAARLHLSQSQLASQPLMAHMHPQAVAQHSFLSGLVHSNFSNIH